LVWSVAGLYLVLVALLNIPAVQKNIGSKVSEALAEKIGTEVKVGSVDLGMLNRIIIDDVLIKDQNQEEMLRAPRLSVKVRIRDLITGKITISSAQLFGLKANLYKKTADAAHNFQFVLDSLASKDTTKHTPLNLEISSLIIRRGEISYNQLDDYDNGLFSPKHINLKDISAHIILNQLTDDSLDLNVKRIALKEKSGLELKKLSLRFVGGQKDATLSNMLLELPHSLINIPKLEASYQRENKKLVEGSMKFNGKITQSSITPCDLSAFTKLLNNYNTPVTLAADVNGTDKNINIGSLSISQANDLRLLASGAINNLGETNDWNADIQHLSTSSNGIKNITSALGRDDAVPAVVANLGNINITGKASKDGNAIKALGKLYTEIGKVDININKVGKLAKADIITDKLNLQKLTNNKDLGLLSAKVSATGNVDGAKVLSAKGNANISSFTFKNHTYNNIKATADYIKGQNLMANIDVVDNAGNINLSGNYGLSSKTPKGSINGKVENLDLAALGLTKKWEGSTFDFEINGDFIGKNINSALGDLTITDLTKRTADSEYHLHSIELKKFADGDTHKLTLISDFATMRAEGDINYATILNSITNAIYDRLPTIPGLKKKPATNNKFNIYGTITRSDWAQNLLGVDLRLFEPAHLIASIDDSEKKVDIQLDAAQFVYGGKEYKDGFLHLSCPNDTMRAMVNVKALNEHGGSLLNMKAQAIDNHLASQLHFLIDGKQELKGEMNADAHFYADENGKSTADVKILPSTILINDTTWNIEPAHILYHAKHLEVENFNVHHDDQHIAINGKATRHIEDEITVDLKEVNVSYILDIVNFHSVEFAGLATGKAKGRSLFGEPEAEAQLHVKDFTFESGCLGDLDVSANWNLEEGAINVDGIALDGERRTDVTGYISPKNSDIALHVKADGTRINFLQKYCDTFLNDIDAYGCGEIDVVGPLKEIQIVGDANVTGRACVTSLNTYYYLNNDFVTLRPDDIIFHNDSIYDRDGHLGIVNGHLRHRHLGNFTVDLDIDAQNLLAYDTHTFDDMPFYGTAFVTGKCGIKVRSGEIVIDVDATPNKGTEIVYNVSGPEALASQEFLTWHDRDSLKVHKEAHEDDEEQDLSADLFLNFLIHATPDATVNLLMDQTAGDYIQLNGDGVIRVSYYDKGTFDMFGNYVVDHGFYKLTIQNVIKRDFEFLQGGSMSFGGDPYNAALNLKAQYTVNGVSLSDLNLGKSFSNNNIRVNCLMDITGTPAQPRVDFSLDMPTVSSDAKQMIMSLMNSEEETKQQVIYLLAIGRFFNQGSNNATTEMGQSQTSLAMQSILSGTISQELSNILSSVVKTNDWNFGANISTGNEGLYNAEYEGIISGRLLNNRLLINGQFGYRDNPNTNSSFIGDFDIRYLLRPSGSMAIKIYNQTNDRYFTKNSLNTQGVGLIFKKDFNGWRDFFRFRREKIAPKAK